MKKAIVTGGSDGIGFAISKMLSDLDFEVYNLDVKPPKEQLENVYHVHADISNVTHIERFVQNVDSIDLLINNAAIQIEKTFLEQSVEELKSVLDVNLFGTLNVTRQIVPKMIHPGHIINIGSIHSTIPRKDKLSYDISKSALDMFTKSLALDLAPNIRVNSLNIGATFSPMNQNYDNNTSIQTEALSKIPMNHIFEPQEIANVVKHMIDDDFKFMTGTILVYDGGRSLN